MTAFIPEAQTCMSSPPHQLAALLFSAAFPPTRLERTDLVNGGSLGSLGQSGANDDLTSRGLTDVGLEDVTKVQILDLLGGDSALSENALDGGDSELDGRGLSEASL